LGEEMYGVQKSRVPDPEEDQRGLGERFY